MLGKAPYILMALARGATEKTNTFTVLEASHDCRTQFWNTDQVETWRNGKAQEERQR